MAKLIPFSSKDKAEAYIKKMKKTHVVAGPYEEYTVAVGEKK